MGITIWVTKKFKFLYLLVFIISRSINVTADDVQIHMLHSSDPSNNWKYRFEISISVPSDAPEYSNINVLALYPGKTIGDFLNANGDYLAVAKYINQIQKSDCGSNNVITFKVTMNDKDPSGYYTYTVVFFNNGAYSKVGSRFFYVSSTDRLKYVNYFNDPALNSTGVINLLTAANQRYYTFIGLDYIYYSKYISQNPATSDKFADSMIKNRPDTGYDENTLADEFNRSSLLFALNNAVDSSQLQSIIEDYNQKSNGSVYKSDSDFAGLPNTPEGKGFVYNYLYSTLAANPFTGADTGANSLVNAFNSATALALFNTATSDKIESLLDKYYVLLNINQKDYLYYKNTSYAKTVINDYISSLDLVKTQDIGKAFSNKISELQKRNTDTGGHTGGTSITYNVSPTPSPTPSPVPSPLLSFKDESDTKFNDLDGFDWAKDSINALVSKGIINGVGNNRFLPQDKITKEQFIKMIVCAFNLKMSNKKLHFKDVNEEEWYYPYISSAIENGIVKGMNNDIFGIGSRITRQDLAVILYRALQTKTSFKNGESMSFADWDKISDYAIEGVKVLAQAGIINGVGKNSFAPLEFATRAQAAVVLYRALQLIAQDV